MKIRAENLIAAVDELRVGLLAVRNLTDTLLSLVEVADAARSSKGSSGRDSMSMRAVCLDRRRTDGALVAFALATVIVLMTGKGKGRIDPPFSMSLARLGQPFLHLRDFCLLGRDDLLSKRSHLGV